MVDLVLLRHGQSEWNLANRYTGWTDVDLTGEGIQEARRAGQLLREAGFQFDEVYTSVLKRAIRTVWIVLAQADQVWVPVELSWRLNERHYGALQGLNKAESAQVFGAEQVFQWRRSFKTRPPVLDRNDPTHPRFDRRYAGVDPAWLPGGESLEDTQLRVLPYWQETILPALRRARTTLVVAHGNSLRALVKYLEDIPDEDIPDLYIPTGVPVVYHFDAAMRWMGKEVLGAGEGDGATATDLASPAPRHGKH
ncbi:MAG: 2,3-diphosphoglycerate-dependent phosphoglycerate mutase [Anaerolineaceae bacterium]|nr:2,3-diphosphoglycerate-dependent phosphoglycerate mutase [Anaerolineaceae bacterium]